MNGHIGALLGQQVVDLLDILVRAGVRGSQDSNNADGVFVAQVHRLLRINDEARPGAVDVLLVDFKVARRLFPAHLHGRRHDYVGRAGVLPLGLALQLPAALHGQDSQHDAFGGPDSRRADHCVLGRVEEVANHLDAAALDLGALWVFFVVDEVLGEGFGHEVLCFLFLSIALELDPCDGEIKTYHVRRYERGEAVVLPLASFQQPQG